LFKPCDFCAVAYLLHFVRAF